MNVTGQHQYQKENSFVREPFVVAFQSDRTGQWTQNIQLLTHLVHPVGSLCSFSPAAIKKFILVPLHTEPSQAAEEIDRLYDVFEEVSNKWNNTVRKRDLTGRTLRS